MAILKNEYEISIWNEYLDSTGKKVESKGAIIGAHDMTYLGRAINPNLRREMKGTNTLTFDMVDKFFDSEKGEFVKNEFIDMLYNEQKIKLHYKDKWYEFYIKNINENKTADKFMKSYECTDSFIEELSRTGYGITFDEELNNSVNELGDFSNEILKDSVWDYRADLNSGDFTEYREERCYKIPLSQFGGSIEAYPINLQVGKDSYNKQSNMFKDMSDEEYSFTIEEDGFNELTNIYSNKSRPIELGDDISREREIFWDPYYKDNGFGLIQGQSKKLLKGDYIYVPYSYLSFIYGSIFQDSYKATEEPACYGRKGSQDLGFALQPYSKDPTELIQFLFFENDDEILIDEEGYIANNDHHYVISIDDWNKTLEKAFSNMSFPTDDNGLIYWKSEHSDAAFSTKYEIKSSNGEDYTVNVRPNTKTIDDFCWYPVYYEGYLEQIGDTDIYGARDISIADRTEYNLNADSYTTIYNNKADEYKGMYSEKEMEMIIENGLEPRVQSISESRIIAPTLARNLIQNGEKITKVDGWEALTQNNTTEFDTGSYANLLTISAKNTSDKDDIEDGNTDDETINDFYLEFLSPNIMKCNDIDYEGNISSDYALNFGLSSKEINIEKDKVYAIRICTGTWTTDSYNIYFRNNSGDEETEEIITENEEDVKTYKNTIYKYYNFLNNYSFDNKIKTWNLDDLINKNDEEQNEIIDNVNQSNTLTNKTEEDFKNMLKSSILEYDKNISNKFEKFENVYLDSDINYIIYKAFKLENKKIPDDKKDIYVELSEDICKSWQNSAYSENRSFGKKYNVDLDKIIIGTGSIDINGNYTLSGTKENSNEDSYISFADIFEKVEDKNIDFVPYLNETKTNIKDLTTTLHHRKVDGLWTWDEVESDINIEDTPYLLFKAKANISTPYVGIKVESEPMTFNIESTSVDQYAETNKSGVKIEVYCEDDVGDKYLANNVNITIYKVDNKNFTEDYLERVGWKIEESSGSNSITDATFTFYTNKDKNQYQSRGVDISYCQAGLDWSKFNGEYTDFAIIKASEGTSSVDSQINTFIKSCVEKKIPFGFYHFAGSNIGNCATEAEHFMSTIKTALNACENSWDYFQLPAFLDLESSILNKSVGEYTQYCKDFVNKLKEGGFYPGIYCSASCFKPMIEHDEEFINSTFIWLAHWTDDPYSIYDGHREIWQISAKTFPFFNQGDGVDYNYCYVKPIKGLHNAAKSGKSLSTDDNTTKQSLSNDNNEDKEENTEKKTIKKEDLNIVSPKEKFDINQGKRTQKISRIIIHSVGSGTEDPYYWENVWKTTKISAHYVVGKNETVQYVSDDYIASHYSGNNADSIGIEQTEPSCMTYKKHTGTDIFSAFYTVNKEQKDYFINYVKEIYERTAKLTAYLCQLHNLEVNKDTIQFHNSTTSFENESSLGKKHVDPLHLWGQALVGDKTFGQLVDGDKTENLTTELTMDSFIERVKEYYDGTAESTDNSVIQDKINRENPNNDYTLKDGDLLSTAKPCWTATSFEDVTSYCSNISPKNGDTCSLAYALFVNNIYYGIFWLDKVDGEIIEDINETIIKLPEDGKYIRLLLNYYISVINGDNKDMYKLEEKFCKDIKFIIRSNSSNELKSEYFSIIGNLSEDKKSMEFISENKPFIMYNLPDGSYQIEIKLSNFPKHMNPIENNLFKIDTDKNTMFCNFNVLDGKLSFKTDIDNTLSLDISYSPYYRFIINGTMKINEDIIPYIYYPKIADDSIYNYNINDIITNTDIEKSDSNNIVILKPESNIIDIIDLPKIDNNKQQLFNIDKKHNKFLIQITSDNSDVQIYDNDKIGTLLSYDMNKFNINNDDGITTIINIEANEKIESGGEA